MFYNFRFVLVVLQDKPFYFIIALVENIGVFIMTTEVRASHILVKTEKEAQDLYDEIKMVSHLLKLLKKILFALQVKMVAI